MRASTQIRRPECVLYCRFCGRSTGILHSAEKLLVCPNFGISAEVPNERWLWQPNWGAILFPQDGEGVPRAETCPGGQPLPAPRDPQGFQCPGSQMVLAPSKEGGRRSGWGGEPSAAPTPHGVGAGFLPAARMGQTRQMLLLPPLLCLFWSLSSGKQDQTLRRRTAAISPAHID